MKNKKQIAILLATAITVSLCQPSVDTSAASVELSKPKIEIKQGQTTTLKVKGTKEKAKWSIKSGKKYIKLQKKRKASVRIKAVRVGTAKVQCKIGKKKLVCKVIVKSKNKKQIPQTTPQETPQATMQSTLVPTSTPSQTTEPTGVPIRTHAPTEDRLMVEPAKSTLLPATDENGLPIDYVGGARYYYFFGSDIQRTRIEEIRFADKIDIPSEALGTLDLSEKQNGSVMAWYTDQDSDNYYEMVIAQEGGVVANTNSSYLLCDVEWVTGLEHLYTSDVVDMSYMFFNMGRCRTNQEREVLDFGDNFDTSTVEKMDLMFYGAMPLREATIRLGRAFCVRNVKSAVLAFSYGEYGMANYIVSSEELKNWIFAPENHCIESFDFLQERFRVED